MKLKQPKNKETNVIKVIKKWDKVQLNENTWMQPFLLMEIFKCEN